ncbi:MAG: hypothetical protein JWM25_1246 [Thermoleophilia bacterium]|nr:hypothetical protein [Thermoleophilia bacterium]MCZ4496663.1 hypothetical protein [Thermoleophilia bacterium]
MEPSAHRPRVSSERAFTIIEVLVAMVLLGVVLAFVGRPMLDGISGANKATATATATRLVDDATDRFRTDTMAALTPDRGQTHIRDASKLARALTDPAFVARSDDPMTPRVLQPADVYEASQTRLTFRADLVADDIPGGSGTECVTWDSSGAPAGRFRLTRVVRAGTACSSGAVLESEVLINDVQRVPGVTYDRLFSYGVLGAAPGCRVSIAPAATGIQMNRVVSIGMSLSALVVRGTAVSEASTRDFISIRSRDNSSYRRALGC